MDAKVRCADDLCAGGHTLSVLRSAGIVAGVIRMPLWAFFVATAAGKTIKYTIAILVGAGSITACATG